MGVGVGGIRDGVGVGDSAAQLGVGVGNITAVGVGAGEPAQTNNELDNKNIFPPLVPVSPFGPVG